jgi:ectoine hydroxylase-related dioxygenase (phytanoyl-CoA dioxygenase family)
MLKDAAIQSILSLEGYAVLDTNLSEQIDQLQIYIDKNFKLSGIDFYYSLMSNSYEANIILRNVIRELLKDFYERFFENYRTPTESFLTKPANTTQELLLHQDWCYTDEHIHTAYNIWIPLNDVKEGNGAMIVLPGSHLWFDNLRSTALTTARISSEYFLKHGAKALPMKKGQALIFHPALFHGSFPNLSPHPRTIVTCNIMPKDALFVYFHKEENDNEVKMLHLDDDAFLRDLNALALGNANGFQEIRQIEYKYRLITEADLIESQSRTLSI